MTRRLWIDTTGEPVITTTPNGERNATRWGWTPSVAVAYEQADREPRRRGGGRVVSEYTVNKPVGSERVTADYVRVGNGGALEVWINGRLDRAYARHAWVTVRGEEA